MSFSSLFGLQHVTLVWSKTLKVAVVGYVENGSYVVDSPKKPTKTETCLMPKFDMGWLWHCHLIQVNMRSLQSLLKGEHVIELTNVNFAKYCGCSACIERDPCI